MKLCFCAAPLRSACTSLSAQFRAPLLAGLLALAMAPVYADRISEPQTRSALSSRVLTQSVLMDVTYAGERLVAVGERGIVLLSDDGGESWRQAKVPVGVTLTRVKFSGAKAGWAVGHYGVVLHTTDAGETWVQQLDGTTAAQLALAIAQSRAKTSPADATVQRQLTEAERLTQDGPDKPFFDLHFFDDQHGFIIGAYNLMYMTEDAGKTWRPWLDRLDNPKSLHLYAIAGMGETLYVAGEQGLVLRSKDSGKTFHRLGIPYAGSFFAIALQPSGQITVAGLRGNSFRSADQGTTWEKVEGSPPISINVATVLQDGSLLLANQAGQLLVSRKERGSLEPLQTPLLPAITAVLPLRDGTLLGVGMRGVMPIAASTKVGR